VRRVAHLIVRGRVQGVGFRAWFASEAAGRSLDGWVRNRADGSVEALFAGEAQAVSDMIALCRRGPPAGRVESVAEFDGAQDPGPGFRILPTAGGFA
jgi:acylphosphatase